MKEINEIFEEVSQKYYFDSIWNDISSAEEEIIENPMYITLNLCRVLAYRNDGLILSKKEGGNWGLQNLPQVYHSLILQALEGYASDKPMKLDDSFARTYAAYMLEQISG